MPIETSKGLLCGWWRRCWVWAYTKRFMLRLNEPSQTKLEQLIKEFGASKAAIIRQLIAQAKPEDFPKNWQMRAAERRTRQPRR
jgi:hypothetical protein